MSGTKRSRAWGKCVHGNRSNTKHVEAIIDIEDLFDDIKTTTIRGEIITRWAYLLSEYDGREAFWHEGLHSHCLEEVRVLYHSKLLL